MAIKKFSELIADENTVLTATAIGDYVLIYDASEPLDIYKVKVISIADFMKLSTETGRQPLVIDQATGDTFYASAAGVLARLAKGSEGQVTADGASVPGKKWIPAGIAIPIGNGIETINAGVQISPIPLPFEFVITSWQILGKLGEEGSIAIDLWVATYAGHPATVANSITGSAKPTIVSAEKATSSTLTGWTPTILSGSNITPYVDSVSVFTQVTLALLGYKKVK
jgi:hypothetical protein